MTRPRWTCRPRLTALLLLLCTTSAPAAAADEQLTFARLADVPALDEAACRAVAEHVAARLRADDDDDAATRPAELPAALRDDALPRAVFVSVSNGTDPARVVMSIERGAGRAADAAIARAQQVAPDVDARQWIKVDVVRHVHALPHHAANPVLGFDTSLQGVAVDVPGTPALLPEELTSRALVTDGGRLRGAAVAEYLANDPRLAAGETAVRGEPHATHRFTTAAFFADAGADGELVELFRGHRPFPPDRLDTDELLLAAGAGAMYLAGATGEDGQFAYLYHADRDEPAADEYNIVRHCGTTWAMIDVYASTRDPDLLAAIERAVAFLLEQTRPVRIGQHDVLGVAWDDEVTLGANALGTLVLAEHARVTGDPRHLKTAAALARAIKAAQTSSGRFVLQRQRLSTGQQFASDSPYYPGEAALALVRLAAVDKAGAAEWLDAAERAAQYLINVRDAGVRDARLPSDHWLLYALDGLHRARPREMYVDHALRLARSIVADQTPDRAGDAPDVAGSWKDGRVNPTSTRVEGLMAAARLARDFGHADDAERFLAAARRGAAFSLRVQVRPETAMYFPHPTRVVGAIREDLRGTDIRIDTVQHCISGLIAVHRAMAR